jgi:hypothetical protein
MNKSILGDQQVMTKFKGFGYCPTSNSLKGNTKRERKWLVKVFVEGS